MFFNKGNKIKSTMSVKNYLKQHQAYCQTLQYLFVYEKAFPCSRSNFYSRIMRLAILLFMCLTRGLVSSEECSIREPCQLKTGELLRHPKQLVSMKQHLAVTLNVEMATVTVGGWLKLQRRTYNGEIGGPTLRVFPGDTVEVNLINTLGKNTRNHQHNTFGSANTTNLFLHGLHLAPKVNNPAVRVEPGERRKYTYKIDWNQPPGTYWYHPGVHGSTLFQVASGMAGMIVVEDRADSEATAEYISALSCPRHCEHEVHLMFQPTLLYNKRTKMPFAKLQRQIHDETINGQTKLADWLSNSQNKIDYFTTNGQLEPRINIQAGQMKRFRLVNGGGIHSLEIEIPVSKTGQECEVYEIAKDGVYLAKPQRPKAKQTLLLPGGRVDWLIRCVHPGAYEILSNPTSQNSVTLGKSGRIKVSLGTIYAIKVPQKSKQSSIRYKDIMASVRKNGNSGSEKSLMKVKQSEIKGRFVVETSNDKFLNRERFPEPSKMRVRHIMPLGGVQEWTLLNADPDNAHVIHIPVNHFQIYSYNAYNGPISTPIDQNLALMIDQNGRLCEHQIHPERRLLKKKKTALKTNQFFSSFTGSQFSKVREWRDTILLPSLSNITIRFIPKDFTGPVLVRSHDLRRQDQGMMMTTQIVKEGDQGVTYTTTSGALPGTCHPSDYYPTVNVPDITIDANTLRNFFLWLYKLKPSYRKQFGDQTNLSQLYRAYLRQVRTKFSNGKHLKEFFYWLYEKFPSYKRRYGDQSYLYQLYDYYIQNNVSKGTMNKKSQV